MNTANIWSFSIIWSMRFLPVNKPTICRVNGMRVAGGQEIGLACDLAVSSDLAIFGQAGPRHGSSPDGGHRLSAMVFNDGRCHVELCFLRNVVRL